MTTEEILWNAYFEVEIEETTDENIESLETELQALYEMTEAEACDNYGVNNRAEAEILIREYWETESRK